MAQDPRLADKEERDAWKTAPLDELVHHIVSRYHVEARVELARLETFTEHAVLVAGNGNQLLVELRDEVARMGAGMRAHLSLEERELFPAILAMAQGRAAGLDAGLLEPLKKLLQDEHEAEAGMFRQIRALTQNFSPFQGPQELQENILISLKALAVSLQRHMFLENQILFPRAI